MRIRNLRYFQIVAEEQSFARAATRVHIEPSPLSRAIRELESELNVPLLHRSNGRIRLTWPGEVFLEEARRILTFWEATRTRVQSAAQGYRGRLRIGLADSLAQPRLTQLLARCREEEPLTEIRITEMTVTEMIRALDHDQIDAGFTIHAELRHSCRKEVAWVDRPAIAIPRNHPLLSLEKIPIQEIVRHPLILCHPESCSGGHNVIRRWFRDTTTLPAPTIAEFVSGHELMMALVAAGYGVGIGLESQVTLYSHPNVIIRPVTDDVPSTTTFIVMQDRPPTPELTRFIHRAQDSEQGTAS
ncbi:LysR family transcriptional regulator [Phytopseudomonas dryadis]|uniref:LysR family transcriptional regulator n=1 Tax=Phytopseudomonas dryadis TaxID=2487520 RepID=A0A4Q9QXZ0_9GAMM|nr:LysR family transcriptional regulator [Pseudomonas dryadis]TBU88468.1 LysR family transcriptional regulator [Pseudomonas dryadis]